MSLRLERCLVHGAGCCVTRLQRVPERWRLLCVVAVEYWRILRQRGPDVRRLLCHSGVHSCPHLPQSESIATRLLCVVAVES